MVSIADPMGSRQCMTLPALPSYFFSFHTEVVQKKDNYPSFATDLTDFSFENTYQMSFIFP